MSRLDAKMQLAKARVLRTRIITERTVLWELRMKMQHELLRSKTLLDLAHLRVGRAKRLQNI